LPIFNPPPPNAGHGDLDQSSSNAGGRHETFSNQTFSNQTYRVVARAHFIDHDNGMDCQNVGGAEVCDPPQGTVHYFDPDQNLPCTRTGAMSICSNM
jgi:hypothetical protein